MNILLIVAVVVVVVLAGVAAYFLSQVRQLEKSRAQAQQLVEQAAQEQKARCVKSIRFLAQGLLEDRLSITEGAMRISVLLDSLEQAEHYRAEYTSFHALAEATAHIPILEDWKKLPIKQKLVFDDQRKKLEADHREFVVDASHRILAVAELS